MQTGHVIRVNRILPVAALIWVAFATDPLVGNEPSPPLEAPPVDDTSGPFAGEWEIVTERGDRFRLTLEQHGNAAIGFVPFGEDRLQINGVVGEGQRLTLVWQIGSLAGTGELSVSEDGKGLEGRLQSDGGLVEGGTWTGTRPGSTPVSLPMGETAKPAAVQQATVPARGTRAAADTPAANATPPPDGFGAATVARAVSIRDQPSSKPGESQVIGTLRAGTTVSVRCASRYWCELSEGGFVSASFLRIGTAAPQETGSIERPKADAESENMPAARHSEAPAPAGRENKLELMIESLFRKKTD